MEPAPRPSTLLAFSPWFPYAVAACLLALSIGQTVEIFRLNAALRTLTAQNDAAQDQLAHLQASNAMTSLRLVMLDAKDPAYATTHAIIAWDPYQHRGAIACDGLPAAAEGHDYQLWVLDPNAPAPISAGVLANGRPFTVPSVSVPNPGFAVTLEPTGGSAEPTTPILFAVAPGA